MSATAPRRFPCCGRLPEGEPPDLDDGTIRLSDAVDRLKLASKAEAPRELAAMLDHLDSSGRFALLKLATGALRVGISARLSKQALANAFDIDVEGVEEVWHGLRPPYPELFDWAEGRSGQPSVRDIPVFRPFMLAHPLDDARVSLDDYAAEWKWDGIRIQLVHAGGETRLFSRTGDDISGSFPDIAEAFAARGVLDGELLVRGSGQGIADRHGGAAASFNALQQRLGRKNVSAKMQGDYPAFVRLYDILFDGDEDVRELPWAERRKRLEAFAAGLDPERFDLSQLIEADSFEALEEMRGGARDEAIEGLMLKRRDSPYVGGRRAGLWYKWKRDPLTADCVLMYAQRGSGKRSSFYSDFTFGCWTEERRAAARRQGLFRLHRRGIEMARPVRSRPHRSSASGRCARSTRAWCSRSRSIRSTRQQTPQVGAGDALPADQPHPHRQAGRRGRHHRGPARTWRLEAAAPSVLVLRRYGGACNEQSKVENPDLSRADRGALHVHLGPDHPRWRRRHGWRHVRPGDHVVPGRRGDPHPLDHPGQCEGHGMDAARPCRCSASPTSFHCSTRRRSISRPGASASAGSTRRNGSSNRECRRPWAF